MKIIEKFADEVIESGAYQELDRVYIINKIKALVGDEDQECDENKHQYTNLCKWLLIVKLFQMTILHAKS